MRDAEHYISTNVNIFCNELSAEVGRDEKGWGIARNMSSMANYLTFDILAELCFGKGSINMLTKDDHRWVVDAILRNAWRCMIVSRNGHADGAA